MVHQGVIVDSLEDIAVNKISAITGRYPIEQKDLVDLYFILEESPFTMNYLIRRASEKDAYLERGDGQLQFATNLLEVKRFDAITTRMIKPLTLEELQRKLAPVALELIRRLGFD